MVKINEKKTAQ